MKSEIILCNVDILIGQAIRRTTGQPSHILLLAFHPISTLGGRSLTTLTKTRQVGGTGKVNGMQISPYDDKGVSSPMSIGAGQVVNNGKFFFVNIVKEWPLYLWATQTHPSHGSILIIDHLLTDREQTSRSVVIINVSTLAKLQGVLIKLIPVLQPVPKNSNKYQYLKCSAILISILNVEKC